MSIVKVSLCMLVITCFVGISYGQSRNDVKGPEAKNYKPWEHKAAGKSLFTHESVKVKQGPEAKNYKPWAERQPAVHVVKQPRISRNELKGPKAKNYKPWNRM